MSDLKNKTTKRLLSKNTKLLTTHAQHAQGLMFTKEKKDFGLVFVMNSPQKIPIHMFCVFYKIDVLWLDEHKKVIDLRANCPPFHPYISHKGRAQYLVEVPSGVIKKTRTKVGDGITWA